MFNELVFRKPPLLKMLKLFRFFLEEFNLPHSIVSLQEDIIFQLKFPSKYYHSSKHNFLLKFNFVCSRLKDLMVNQKLEKNFLTLGLIALVLVVNI